MSLLNQVLQDLDERAPVSQARSAHLTVAPPVEDPGEDLVDRRSDWLRLGGGILVVSVFVGAVWLFYPAGDNLPAGAPTTAVPPAVVAATDPDDLATGPASPQKVDTTAVPIPTQPVNPPTAQPVVVAPVQAPVTPRVAVSPPPVETADTATVIAAPRPSDPTTVAAGKVGSDALVATEEPEDVTYLELRNTGLPATDEAGSTAMASTSASTGASQGVKTAKNDAPEAVERARQAIDRGELSSAEALLQKHLLVAAEDRDARELLVGLMLRGGRYDSAMQQLDEGLVHHPRHGKFLLIKARMLAQFGQTESAIRILEATAQTDSGRVERLQMLGALYQQQSRFAKAVESYRALLKIDEKKGSSWVGLAISLDGQGDANALHAYRRALGLGGLPQAAESYARQRVAQLELHGG